MAFRFSLESVLRLRRSEQQLREIILQKANDQVAAILWHIETLEAAGLALSVRSRQITGAELEFAGEQLRVLAMRRAEALTSLENAREHQRLAENEFRQAWQRREALEVLRQREHELYRVQERRLEQRVQDDLFLRSTRNRHRLPSN